MLERNRIKFYRIALWVFTHYKNIQGVHRYRFLGAQ